MKYSIFILVLLLFAGCKKEAENPTGPDENRATGYVRSYVDGVNWEASDIYVSESGTVINISAVKSTAEIKLQIQNINQPGNFSIGENEPGFTYFIKAKYIQKAAGGTSEKIYTAYFRDYSYLTISDISEGTLDADFVFLAYSEDFTDSVNVTNGAINIDY
jgi:hypothetical protein